MQDLNYYALLSIAPDASPQEIRRAYIRISRIIHPDRFDAAKQYDDWKQANEMLRRINTAYETLKDPQKRARYDRENGFRNRGTQPQSAKTGPAQRNAARAARPQPGPDPTQRLSAGSKPFEKLPPALRNKLYQRERGRLRDHYYVQIDQAAPHYLKAGVLLLWMCFAFFSAAGTEWSAVQAGGFFILHLLSFLYFSQQLVWLIKWHRSKLSSSLYITPLYVVKTHHDMVYWWPVTSIQNIRITNGGGYYFNTTMLNLHYKNEVARFSVAPVQIARNCVQAVYSYKNKADQAVKTFAYDYIHSNNDFQNIESQPPPDDKALRYAAFGGPILLAFLLFGGLMEMNRGNEPYIGSRLISQMLPHNGSRILYVEHEGRAPLELEASPDHHFLVKVRDAETYMPVYTVFVRAGESVGLKMPDGRYSIRYTAGRTWYGPEAHFGKEGIYMQESREYVFSTEGQELSGHFIRIGNPQRIARGDIRPLPEDEF